MHNMYESYTFISSTVAMAINSLIQECLVCYEKEFPLASMKTFILSQN